LKYGSGSNFSFQIQEQLKHVRILVFALNVTLQNWESDSKKQLNLLYEKKNQLHFELLE
jgi:hypothetical protein